MTESEKAELRALRSAVFELGHLVGHMLGLLAVSGFPAPEAAEQLMLNSEQQHRGPVAADLMERVRNGYENNTF